MVSLEGVPVWLGLKGLLPALQSALVVERQVIGWFSVKHPDPECCTPSGKFPVFLLQDEEDFWYGFPQFGHNGLKIGKFDRENNIVSHPNQLDRRVLPQDEEVNFINICCCWWHHVQSFGGYQDIAYCAAC